MAFLTFIFQLPCISTIQKWLSYKALEKHMLFKVIPLSYFCKLLQFKKKKKSKTLFCLLLQILFQQSCYSITLPLLAVTLMTEINMGNYCSPSATFLGWLLNASKSQCLFSWTGEVGPIPSASPWVKHLDSLLIGTRHSEGTLICARVHDGSEGSCCCCLQKDPRIRNTSGSYPLDSSCNKAA